MKRSLNIITALLGSLMLMAAAAGTASANYGGGYADGGPGPADTWAATHPSFGKVTGGERASHVLHVHKAHTVHHHAT